MKLLAAQVTVPVSGSLEPIHQKQHQCLHLSERLYSFPLSHSTQNHLFFFLCYFHVIVTVCMHVHCLSLTIITTKCEAWSRSGCHSCVSTNTALLIREACWDFLINIAIPTCWSVRLSAMVLCYLLICHFIYTPPSFAFTPPKTP